MDSNFTNETNETINNQFNEVPATEEKKGLSIASMVLGICGLLAWCLPCLGYPVTITGLVLGIIGMKKGGKGMAIAGIILSALCLIFTLINSILGVILSTNLY